MPLQIRRGTNAERTAAVSLIPQQGELVWITDDQKLYIGDGTTELKNLTPISGYNDEDAADHIGAVLQAGPHTGLSFNYVDAAGTISATISPTQSLTTLTVTGTTTLGTTNISGNLVVDGLLTADYKGSIFADDSTTLVDALSGVINLDDTIDTNLIPKQDAVYDLGSPSRKFKDAYLSGSSLWLGNAQITSNGTGINLPAGSTINGGPIGGAGTGQSLNVDIVGDDSTIIVNSSTNTISGTFVGDMNGSVFSDNSTLLVDAVDSKLTTGDISLQGYTVSFSTADLVFRHETLATDAQVVFESTSADTNMKFLTITDGTSAGGIQFATSRTGINGSEASVQVNDPLGFQVAQGWDGSAHTIASIIAQRVDPNGSVAGGAVTGEIDLFTFTDGNIANSKGVIINRNGYVSINKTSSEAQATLDINGFAKLAPLAAAPATLVNGLIAIDDGTTNWSGHASGVQAVVAYINTGWVKLNN